jgi:DNA repair protein RadC
MKNVVYSSFKIRMEKIALQEETVYMNAPEDSAKAWKDLITKEPWFTESQEIFAVLHLNTKGGIIGHHLVGLGTLDSCLAHPRDVFRAAIINNSRSIILMHSHPSGDTAPSDADIRITREMKKAGDLLHIEVLDHTIVSPDGENYTSLREKGYFYSA